ncbi:MAG: 3-dehydroquinate synthase [Gammaproteobacteria bacterium]|jgi:3-dehydroquinate synthase|nr:3-dehydroquinate synthase [Gammaproteobacteria bacterium]
MEAIKSSFPVYFNYQVQFTHGLFDKKNPLFVEIVQQASKQPSKLLWVIEQEVANSQPELTAAMDAYCQHHQLQQCGKPLVIGGGEAIKNDSSLLKSIYQAINEHGICRHSYIVAVGGGALLDMVGFAAATAHRGIRLIRVPTTVLAQADSGVGVKNAINYFDKKNFLGCFAPPYAVLNDFNFLISLPQRDWRAGMAEAVKVALIKDAEFFYYIQQQAQALTQRSMPAMQHLVRRCAALHAAHISGSGDPFEFGSSRPLDFGHWAAHKLEHLTAHRLRHGEAVAIGLALDSTYSYLAGYLAQNDWQQILATLQDLGFTLYVPELSQQLDKLEHPLNIFRGLREFQEHLGGELTIMLLEKIGQGKEVHTVDIALFQQAILLLKELR